MRIIVNGGGLAVVLVLIILIHTSIINKSVRDNEVNAGLESAADYALDVMTDKYKSLVYDESKEAEYTEMLMQTFCEAVEEMIGTDGNITVSVIASDLKTGTFDIIIQEEYKYSFMGRTGKCSCERAVTFV